MITTISRSLIIPLQSLSFMAFNFFQSKPTIERSVVRQMMCLPTAQLIFEEDQKILTDLSEGSDPDPIFLELASSAVWSDVTVALILTAANDLDSTPTSDFRKMVDELLGEYRECVQHIPGSHGQHAFHFAELFFENNSIGKSIPEIVDYVCVELGRSICRKKGLLQGVIRYKWNSIRESLVDFQKTLSGCKVVF